MMNSIFGKFSRKLHEIAPPPMIVPPADDYFINLRLVPGYALYLFIDISAHDKTCNGLSFLGTT